MRRWPLLALVIALAGCEALSPQSPVTPTPTEPPSTVTPQARGPSRSVIVDDRRTTYYFERDAGDFALYALPGDEALFRVEGGALEGAVVPDRGFIWTLNEAAHTDVIISATLQMTQGGLGSAYGVICRADEAGNGYYFLLGNDGSYSIQVAGPGAPDLVPLVPWRRSAAVNFGYQPNTIRAVCVRDYLALFVNDAFVAEAFDDEFSGGRLGLALAGAREAAWVRFDDVLIQDALMLGERDPFAQPTPTFSPR